ncbi:TerC family protein, partial [Bacillus cereus]
GKMVTHEDRLATFFHNNPSFTTSIPYLFIFTILCIGFIVQQVRLRNVKH